LMYHILDATHTTSHSRVHDVALQSGHIVALLPLYWHLCSHWYLTSVDKQTIMDWAILNSGAAYAGVPADDHAPWLRLAST